MLSTILNNPQENPVLFISDLIVCRSASSSSDLRRAAQSGRHPCMHSKRRCSLWRQTAMPAMQGAFKLGSDMILPPCSGCVLLQAYCTGWRASKLCTHYPKPQGDHVLQGTGLLSFACFDSSSAAAAVCLNMHQICSLGKLFSARRCSSSLTSQHESWRLRARPPASSPVRTLCRGHLLRLLVAHASPSSS
jgi:hypothetical protein